MSYLYYLHVYQIVNPQNSGLTFFSLHSNSNCSQCTSLERPMVFPSITGHNNASSGQKMALAFPPSNDFF